MVSAARETAPLCKCFYSLSSPTCRITPVPTAPKPTLRKPSREEVAEHRSAWEARAEGSDTGQHRADRADVEPQWESAKASEVPPFGHRASLLT